MLPDFSTLADLRTLVKTLPGLDASAAQAAIDHNEMLTKPPRALARLEDLAIWYAGWRGQVKPQVQKPQVIVFAGNHGVTGQGVSAFPQEVTAQMVANFRAEGAAVNQLARLIGAKVEVHALRLDQPTADFTTRAAMSETELLEGLMLGWSSVDATADVLVVGEMGIGNTTSGSALCLSLFGGTAADWTGRGTGISDVGLELKTEIVTQAVALHETSIKDGLDALKCLGGRELAAMAGAILAARYLRIPVILDGFICCAAAACLRQLNREALDHCIAGHQSAEAAHSSLLSQLNKQPLLSLGLRLGEGSGAVLAVQILKGAIACHSGMATFAEAGVEAG